MEKLIELSNQKDWQLVEFICDECDNFFWVEKGEYYSCPKCGKSVEFNGVIKFNGETIQ